MEFTYEKRLEIRYTPDVFVAGGGPAGIAAAIACARQGKQVFVVDSFSAFGGAADTMLVPAFKPFGDSQNFLAGGIGREIYDRLKADAFPRFRRYCPMSIPVEQLKRLYDDMIEEAGVRYLFHTSIVDAITKDGRIDTVICAAKGSMFGVRAKVYIDCTGDGDLAHYAGAHSEYGDENGKTMAATLCGIWDGIDWGRVKKPDNRNIDAAFRDHVFQNEDRHLPGMWPIAEGTRGEDGALYPNGVGGSNAGHVYDVDAREAASLTEGIVRGRRQLMEYRRYYREYLTGYENTELLYSASYLGIRESRRVDCDYRLVLDDFVNRAVFEDEIGRYNYGVDIHSPVNTAEGYRKFLADIQKYQYKPGESYGIPYRTLTVAGLSNLYVAGRCICTDRNLQSSVRVMPGCYITGQAAGVGAALTCDTTANCDIRAIDTHELQKRLVALGAFLPHYRA